MKYLLSYKDMDYDNVSSIVYNLHDKCLELLDNGIKYKIVPENDIDIKLLSLKVRRMFDVYKKGFYLSVETTRLTDEVKRTGEIKLPNWFREFSETLIEYMKLLGWVTNIEIKRPSYTERIKSVDELMDIKGLVFEIIFNFEASLELYDL